MMSKSINVVLVPIIFIALMSDFPKVESSKLFYISRLSRFGWIIGELIFALMSAVTYVLALFAGTTIYCIGKASFSNQYSDFTLKLFEEYPEIYSENTHLFLTASTYTQGTPFSVLAHSILLILLYIMVISLIISLFKLLNLGGGGVVLSVAISICGLATDQGTTALMWVLPITHSVFGWHFNSFYSKAFFNLGSSYIYFALVIIALLIANLILSRKVRLG